MAVLSVRERWQPRRGGKDSAPSERTTRSWNVLTDAITDTTVQVLDSPDLPAIGSTHPDRPEMRLEGFDAAQDSGTPYLWRVTGNYTTRSGSLPQGEPLPANPLLRSAKYSMGGRLVRRAAERGYFLKPDGTFSTKLSAITNSALMRIEPPIELEESHPVIQIVRNEATDAWANAALYRDAINTDAFAGFAAGTCKFDPITSDGPEFDNDIEYWVVTYRIQVNLDGWDTTFLDRGTHEIIGNVENGKPRYEEIMANDGKPVREPVPLNGAGRALDISAYSPGQDPVDAQGNTLFKYRTYRLRTNRRAFGPLNLYPRPGLAP